MGINDNNKEDAFEWSDGSPFAFINWRDGGRKLVLTTLYDCVLTDNFHRNVKFTLYFCKTE